MAIITLRLNQEEERVLDLLVKHFEEDKSKVLKEAMWEKFEEIRDRELIEGYEALSRAGKIRFESADDLVSRIEEKKVPYEVVSKKAGRATKKSRPHKRAPGSK